MTIPLNTPFSIRLGVIGAGVMGRGIALTALYKGLFVSLYDTSAQALAEAQIYIQKYLERKNQASRLNRLQLTSRLEDLTGAAVLIEAAPEDLELKRKLFARLDELLPPPAILASNTSSLSITAIAAAVRRPERVAGMHFFNPAPVLPLVEVIRGAQTSSDTLQTLVNLAEFLGKTPVVARDAPGFIVNRTARPFYGEALRLAGVNAAAPGEIDRLLRLGGGFRMGPFELMDLVGIDVNLAVMQSMYDQTFGEPRYRPHWLQVQMVQQGALGRKSGRGFYDYANGGLLDDPQPPRPRRSHGLIDFSSGTWAPGLIELCRNSGYTAQTGALSAGGPPPVGGAPVAGVVIAGSDEDLERQVTELEDRLPPDALLLCQCADVALSEIASWLRQPERLVGFDGLFFTNGPAATLVAGPAPIPQARAAAEDFVRSLGRFPIWIDESPGLVLPRVVAMLANEAAFGVYEGLAEPAVIDQAMQLGTQYPHGPLAWAKKLGYAKIIAVLTHMFFEFGEDRYRVCPLLRRWERLERITL